VQCSYVVLDLQSYSIQLCIWTLYRYTRRRRPITLHNIDSIFLLLYFSPIIYFYWLPHSLSLTVWRTLLIFFLFFSFSLYLALSLHPPISRVSSLHPAGAFRCAWWQFRRSGIILALQWLDENRRAVLFIMRFRVCVCVCVSADSIPRLNPLLYMRHEYRQLYSTESWPIINNIKCYMPRNTAARNITGFSPSHQ
jgi:hypothetical protein